MKRIFIISIVLSLCTYSCVYDYVGSFQVINYSDEGQIVYYTCSDMIGTKIDSFSNRYYERLAGCKFRIDNEDVYIDKKSFKWVEISFRKKDFASDCKDKHIRFFFISDSVFMNHSWDTIVKYQMYNRKLVFSEEELKKDDWAVVYE